jgi:hypothetical protein
VAKALRLGAAVVVLEIGVGFGASVVGNFEDAALGKRPGGTLAHVLERLLAFCRTVEE